MAKKTTPEATTEPKTEPVAQQKVQTKYDRKMEARRQQKIKEAKQEKLTRLIGGAIGILVVAALIISIGVSIASKWTITHGTYVKVGDHEISQLEYNYYFNSSVNTYGAYMGIDASMDLEAQPYADGLTLKDMFDEMTIEQIQQVKATIDEAQKNAFDYNSDEEYDAFKESFKEGASTDGTTVKEYYKQNFGDYATEKNMEPIIRENLMAGAYYNKLVEDNAPSEDEVKAYYEENQQSYDRVDYRSFVFKNDLADDASEDEIADAMEELKTKADAMMEARKGGEDFEELCIQNAAEEDKANYEDAETEYCLSEGRRYAGVASTISDWLFEENRTEGDITVLEDEANHRYYVVEFIKRYFDEADNESISDTIASQRTSEYVSGLIANYPVEDVKGNLKYLTVNNEDEASDESTDEAEENTETNEEGAAESEGTDTESDGE